MRRAVSPLLLTNSGDRTPVTFAKSYQEEYDVTRGIVEVVSPLKSVSTVICVNYEVFRSTPYIILYMGSSRLYVNASKTRHHSAFLVGTA